MARKTPAQMRTDSRVDFSRMLYRWLGELDITQAELADLVGAQHQKVQRWCDPNCPEVPGFSDLRLFPRELARRCLSWLGDEHGVHVIDALELPGTEGGHLAHVQTMLREGAEAVDAFIATHATPTGAPDPAARRTAVKELREAASTYLARAKLLEDAERDVSPRHRGVA